MATVELKLQPFRVPNYVLTEGKVRPRQDGFHPEETPKYALNELDEETLSALCDEFRKGVFEKAGKKA
jgi:hypothetical protein